MNADKNSNSTKNTSGQHPLDRYTVASRTNSPDQKDNPFYQSAAPAVTLPKGGGALRGIDEKFSVNAVNGTASLNINLPFTPARGGFTPALALSYNSGSGNSEFGLGWNLNLPSIQRRTDKRLPQYRDDMESDVFMLSGAEDFVPVLDNGIPLTDTTYPGYTIRYYKPRIEGLFARIEMICPDNSAEKWWRVTTRDNIVTYYGYSANSRLCDPDDETRIYKWLPELIVDNKGNLQQYIYRDENLDQVPHMVHERNRLNTTQKIANKYLKWVRYCNQVPYFVDDNHVYAPVLPSLNDVCWMEAVLDYGEHGTMPGDDAYDNPDPHPYPMPEWHCRYDAFSQFHPGFEIRTYRKCRRVLFFHYFRELNGGNDIRPTLVRSLDFTYEYDGQGLNEADMLKTARSYGYKRNNTGYDKATLPAMNMVYEPLAWSRDLKDVAPADAVNMPQGLTGHYEWIDLWGEGLPGILFEEDSAWFYKSNLGNARFTPAAPVAGKPSFHGLGNELQWQDLDADGRRQLVIHTDGVDGYFELNDDQEWERFVPFACRANVNTNSPYTKMLDLDGDGRADLLVTEDYVWTWYENMGTKGFTEGGRRCTAADEEKGPKLLLNDNVQRIFLADMNGDGMTDLVRITNGEVCYWPNMGYGKFGAKVTMSNAPLFAHTELFNPVYLTLADISGTGAADIIYLGNNKCTAYINLAGNAWAEGYEINPMPSVEPYSKIAILDFLGNGTGCIVWSSPLPRHSYAPVRYIDLMGGRKPYLMKSYDNGMGKSISITYKSAAQFYAADKLAGRPWATRLPFPVQCISEIVTADSVSDTRYIQQYSYRHGYYDHEEREFRGFGYVETTDTDTALLPGYTSLDQPPVLTKTWYHTGAWMREHTLLDAFGSEYYPFDNAGDLPVQATFPGNLTAQEIREAHRALKGTVLRQEVYALDGQAGDPYTVSVHAWCVHMEQEQGDNRYASFYTYQQQKLAWSCERNLHDARLLQQFTLAIDAYGNILDSVTAAYARNADYLPVDPLLTDVVAEQQKAYITYTHSRYTNDVTAVRRYYRTPVLCEASTYELRGVAAAVGMPLLTYTDLDTAIGNAAAIDFTDTTTTGLCLRLLDCSRTLFRSNDTANVLPLLQAEALAIPHEQYRLVFTNDILQAAYSGYVDNSMLQEGGYIHSYEISQFPVTDPDWVWIPSGTVKYSQPEASFYMPYTYRDPWQQETNVSYWSDYFLMPQVVQLPSALPGDPGSENIVEQYDWRILQPVRTRDLNDNFSEIVYDALGLPVAMAMKGKDNGTEGDLLEYNGGHDLIDANSAADIALQGMFWDDPETYAADLLGKATWRCVYDFASQPAAVAMIGREQHYYGPVASPPVPDGALVRITYTDGLGRVIMHKAQAEADDVNGYTWIGSGRTVYNNKGNPVMQFEPYYSPVPQCDTVLQAAAGGVSSKLYYDPLGRAFRVEMPDGSYTRMEWTNWMQYNYDNNDTLGYWDGQAGAAIFNSTSSWYDDRFGGAMGPDEKDASYKAALHADTPIVMHFDTLARPVHTVQHNRNEQGAWTDVFYHSFVKLDISGDRMSVHDARGNTQLQYLYNMVKSPVWQYSIDGGAARMFTDIAGQLLYSWDADDRRIHTSYDALRRPLAKECDGIIMSRTVYGEGQTGNDRQNNLRGMIFELRDGPQLVTNPYYSFTGMPEYVTSQFTDDKQSAETDWTYNLAMEAQLYDTSYRYDAFGRLTETKDAIGNRHYNYYNRTGLLFRMYLIESGTVTVTKYIQDIHYDAKGQRLAVWYGNDTKTRYTYDPLTYRLRRLLTTDLVSNSALQDLNYYYDPAGNITRIRDDAQQDIFYDNALVAPVQDYTYDALYQLIIAQGREQIGTAGFGTDDNYNDKDWTNIPHKGDWQALQNYTQYYTYDETGNILELNHSATTGSYTRSYTYDTGSNRLWSTDAGGQHYDYYNGGNGYDAHGNMLNMPHLLTMSWSRQQALCYVRNGTYDTWYQYTGSQRVRKYWEKNGQSEVRMYLGNVEIYRRYDSSNNLDLERTSTHITGDSGRVATVEVRTYGTDSADPHLQRYIYSNHLGSAALELTEKAEVISYEEYHPFGSTSYQGINASIKATAKRYRYSGKERDEESGLYYHGARYYACWLGRWTAVDPLEADYAGWSGYNYCTNNPVKYHDPNGLGHSDPAFAKQVKAVEDSYAKMNNKKLSQKDRDAAKASFIKSMDALIDDIDKVTNRATHVELDKDMFFQFLKLKGYATDSEKTTYELGCVGITMTMTNLNQTQLKQHATSNTYSGIKDTKNNWVYAIHLSDTQLLKQDPLVKKAYNEKKAYNAKVPAAVAKEAERKYKLFEDSDPKNDESFNSMEADYINNKNFIKAYDDKNVDYKKLPNGQIDVTSWDMQASFVGQFTNFDFGLYYKSNVVFHANHGVYKNDPGNPMLVYISNKSNFEMKITSTGAGYEMAGCDPANPCFGYYDFNRQVFGSTKK